MPIYGTMLAAFSFVSSNPSCESLDVWKHVTRSGCVVGPSAVMNCLSALVKLKLIRRTGKIGKAYTYSA